MRNHTNTPSCRSERTPVCGDPASFFRRHSPREILDTLGPPRCLLSSSRKTEKCLSVDVLARVLFLTPGLFCSHATPGCLASCLGHCSGRMPLLTQVSARDRRSALYLENPALFNLMLSLDLAFLDREARSLGLHPAARLNGSSDIPWEEQSVELFRTFPQIRFFDYTKNPDRMHRFLSDRTWPANYHLTFSAAPGNHDQARNILAAGGTVAVVFWPHIPRSFWGYPVIDGDTHDARFLDPQGAVVALTAKGLAQQDRTGFTVHVCPSCAHKDAA